MSKYTFTFENKQFGLSYEEILPFYNRDEGEQVNLNSTTEFTLHNGEKLIGKVIDIDIVYAVDEGGNSDHPIQVKFEVNTVDNMLKTLKFYEIQSHNLAPFKSSNLFL